MKLVRALVIVGLCLLSPAAPGADVQTPPDPAKLATDWWSYFIVGPNDGADALQAKFQSAKQYLEKSKEILTGGETEKLVPLFDVLIQRLTAYLQIKTAKPMVQPPTVVPAESYSIKKVLEIASALRKTKLDHSVESQEVKRLKAALKSGEEEQDRRKLAYLKLPDSAPDRVEQGLLLMQNRLQLEIAGEQLRRRNIQKEILQQRIVELEKELGVAPERLRVDPDRVSFWDEQKQKAETRLNGLKVQLARIQLDQSVTPVNTAIDQAQTQLGTQKTVLLETDVAAQQVTMAQADWAAALIKRVQSGNTTEAKPDRELLKRYAEQLKDIKQSLADWHRTTNQSRNTAMAQLAEEKDPQLSTMYESRVVVADETAQKLRNLEDELDNTTRLSELLDRLVVKQEGHLGRGVQLAGDAAEQTWVVLYRFLTTSLFKIGETPVTSLGLARLVIIILLAWFISKLIRRGLRRVSAGRETVSQASIFTLWRILHYFILTIAVLIGLSSIGVDFTKFALVASALGIGIGFGLQNLVSNFVAGLIILFERSLKVEDFVELESGVSGEVREINMRSTLVTTNDNIDILVPNSEFVNGRVTNWTMREAYRRVHIPFGVAYGTDKDLVKKAVLEAAEAISWTLKAHKGREPQVWFVEFGDSSLNFELVVWLTPDAVKRPSAVNAAYLWEIESKLKQYGIEIPFPQRDLHLRSAFGKKDEAGLSLLPPRTGET